MEKFENVGEVKQTTASTWEWTIKDFNLRYSEARVLYSANISVSDQGGNTKWFCKVYPKGGTVLNKDYLGVYIGNLDETNVTACVTFSVILRTVSEGTLLYSFNRIEPIEFFTKSKFHGLSNFVSCGLLQKETNPSGILRIQIQIAVVRPDILPIFENNETNRLEDDFEKLFHSEKHTDVTFNVNRKKIYLHKAILANRSSYFEAMFEHDMKENVQNVVKITDTKLKIFKEMCRYIYAGRVNNIGSIAKDLLIAADKYCIEELSILCEKTLCNQLNNDNALEYLVLAKKYNAVNLEMKVFEYIKNNIGDIYEKPDFKQLDPEIKDEIFGMVIGKSRK